MIQSKRSLIIVMTVAFFSLNAYSQCSVTGSNSVCTGDVKVYQTAYSGSIYQWTVTGGNLISSVNGTATVQWAGAGVGVVSVQIKDVNQTVLAACSLTVTVNPLPQPVITSGFITECVTFIKENDEVIPVIDPDECWKVCDSTAVLYSTPLNAGSSYVWEGFGSISVTPNGSGNEAWILWGLYGHGLVRVTETSASGCVSIVEHCINIIRRPTASLQTVPAFTVQPNGNLELSVCLYENIAFSGFFNPGNSNSPVMNWLWDFGDGQFSVEQNPNHSYDQPGTYEVQLTVTNQCGCQDIVHLSVYVNDKVPPSIECPTPVCENDTATYFTFANCSTYLWTVTNGTILSPVPYGSSIQVVWDNGSNGPGIVTLQTPGCGDFCDEPTSIEIPILFQGFTISGPASVCLNQQVAYSVPLIPGTVYTWDVPGASMLIGQGTNEILVEWNTVGNRTIRVDYGNEFLGCDGFYLKAIKVKNSHLVSSSAEEICDFGSITFTTTPSGIFNWQIQNTSTEVIVQTHASVNGDLVIGSWPHGPGTFKISSFGTGYCNWQSVFLTVSESPAAPGLITGDDYVCANTPHLYTTTPSASNYFIKWFVTNGSPATMEGNEITVTWGSSGPYSLYAKQVDMNTGCESEPSAVFDVHQIVPVAPLVAIANPQCVNSIVTYTISNANLMHSDEIEWVIFPATAGSVIQTNNGATEATIQWNATATTGVEIQIRVKTCGVLDLASPYIFGLDLVEGPEIEIEASPNPVCDGSSVDFSVLNLPAGTYTYQWTFPNMNSSSDGSPSYTFDRNDGNEQDVSVIVTDANQCVSSANTIIYVNPNPGANIVIDGLPWDCPDYTLTALQVGPNYQTWWGGGQTTSSITISSEGVYYLDVLDIITGCWSSDFIEIICEPFSGDLCITDPAIDFTLSAIACNEVAISLNGSLPSAYLDYFIAYGDGQIGPTTSTSHVYSLPGVYTVCIQGDIPGGGCASNCKSIDLSVFPDFDYAFECLPNPIQIPGSPSTCTAYYAMKVFDKSIYNAGGNTVSWTWSDASGVLATGQHPSSIPLCSGSQDISLTLSYGSVSCTKVITVNVPDPPNPTFSISAGPVCEDFTPVQFTYTGTGISNIASAIWSFGDDSYSDLFPLAGPQTERVYDLPIPHYPSLTVTDLYGCSYSSSQSSLITVNANNLNATYTPQSPISFCPGGGQLLGLLQTFPSNPDAYLWSTGATSSSIWVSQTGAYSVTMSSSVTGCENLVLEPAQVAVHNIPYPVINGQAEYCEGETISLIAFQGTGYNYYWSATKDGLPFTNFSASGGSLDITNVSPGNYVINLNLSSSNSPCTTATSFNFVVHSNPPLPDISSDVNPACEGELITLSVSNAGTNYVNWSNGTNGISTQVYNAGIYRATFTNEGSCTSVADFIVNPEPDFSFILSGCFDYCSSDEITIPGDAFHSYQSWEWQVTSAAGVSTTGGSGNVDPLLLNNLDPGFYSIQLVATTMNGCVAYSDPIDLSIKSCECPLFQPDPDIKFYCMYESANGIINSHTTISLPSNLMNSDCLQQGTALIITSPDGSFTPLIGFPNDPIEGIFVPYTAGLKTACFDFNLENSSDEYKHCNCLGTYCADLPEKKDCPYPDDCDMQMSFDEVRCTEGGAPNVYAFTLSITTNSDYTVWFSVANGTLSGMPSTLINGLNVINGLFTLTSPPYDEFCINLNAYDPTTQKYCQLRICYEDELPRCVPHRIGSGNSSVNPESEFMTKTSLTLFPNPASDQLNVSYRIGAGTGLLKIMDTQGREKLIYRLSKDEGLAIISTAALDPGIYHVKIESDRGDFAISRLMIIK